MVPQSPRPAVQQWEDAHSSFFRALASYIDTCMNLKNSSLAELATNAEDLVPRIERHTSLSSFLAHQIFQTCSILSAARNQLASPIYALPEEVLAVIFSQVVYESIDGGDDRAPRSMEHDLRSIYRRLYTLIGVCSFWRNVAVRNKSLWSVVPMIDKCKCPSRALCDVMERSLRRSDNAGLHLAINTSLPLPELVRPLINHGNRIRALNIWTESRRNVEKVISTLATSSTPGILSELSVCLEPVVRPEGPSDGRCAIIELPFLRQERLEKILGSLRSLRIRVAHINLYGVSFVNLVELRIESLKLGDRLMFRRLLGAISSASKLQYLRLVSVSSYFPRDPDSIEDDELSISLPDLKIAYIAGMWFNDLEMIFKSVVPGNAKWTLSLGNYCLAKNVRGIYPEVTVEQLGLILQGFNVDTLMLSGRGGQNWLDGPQLSQLLRDAPTITTLQMHSWNFYQQDWEALTRPRELEGPASTTSRGFPRIHNLHIYTSEISDEGGIQAAVKSHDTQQLRLGGLLDRNGDNVWDPIRNEDQIAVWLASNVPDFRLMDFSDSPEPLIEGWCMW
ncbi:hypothetical protein FRC11_008492 [Ceratobasidium sp. 423]|nr:hypothetical protein FRC11_008492 [Ceratobasidium sp. 423]